MSQPPIPSLKRPRSTSDPPSPSSSSSPKRAPSEDVYPASSDSGRNDLAGGSNGNANGNGWLSPSMQNGPGSSPLRDVEGDGNVDVDVDGDVDVDDDAKEAWVKRTEDVHLDGDVGEEEREKYKERYNELLALLPPPYRTWGKYYVVPASLLSTLKTLAFGDDKAASPSDLRIDLSPLIESEVADEVYVIGSGPDRSAGDDSRKLRPSERRKEKLWSLKEGLVESEDFIFVPMGAWNLLTTWYPYNGPSLPRYCMPGERIQMHPPVYTLYVLQPPSDLAGSSAEDNTPIRLTCPSEAPFHILVEFASNLIGGSSGLSRLWMIDAALAKENNDPAILPALKSRDIAPSVLVGLNGRMLGSNEPTDETCSSKQLEGGDTLVLEIKGSDWIVDLTPAGEPQEKLTVNMPPVSKAPPPLFSKPAFFGGSGVSSASSAEGSNTSDRMTRSQSRPRRGKGLVGLVNLGNTCFMNSAVQCLSNTVELNDYFISGVYRDELNPDNPLGMGGQVAEAFGGVIEALWSSSAHSSFSPRNLKWTTSRFAPQFAGYGQHDTQEFIAFLLDGLHEDLNRIKKKPYIEKPDWKPGGGATELAELGKECWEGYKKRNDSVIVDLFQGQLQSTLVCPECHKESITLDPFMYLTVPLPIAQYREFKLRYISRDPDQPPVKVRLLIGQNAPFQAVKDKLAQLVKVNPSHLVGFDLWKGQPYSWFIDADHNGEAKDSDEPTFHDIGVPVVSNRKVVGTPVAADGSITVPVYTCKTPEPGRYRNSNDGPSQCEIQPFFITLSKTEATDPVAVREAISRGYGRFVRSESKPRLWVPQGHHRAASHLPVVHDEEQDKSEEGNKEPEQDSEQATATDNGDEKETPPDNDDPKPDLLQPEPTLLRNASSTSLSSVGSVKPGAKLVPRGDLFKVHVADASTADGAGGLNMFKSKEPIVPLWKGNFSSATGSWSIVENRRKAKKNMLNRLTSGINSIVNYASDDEASPPATPVAPPPVVRPGEGIFVEWSHKRFHEFFASHPSHRTDEIVDPAIAKERSKDKGKAISIEDCLDEFSKEETLGQDDLWYCPQCKKHQAATKKLEIYKAPDILVICIKRFGSSRRLSDKLDNLVNFPIDGLDLEERIGERKIAKTLNLSDDSAKEYGIESMGEEMVYDLYAVDNHFGGLGGGHYTAFCRNREDGEWYNYDDSRVSKAVPEAVQSRAAYLLFYRRRAARPIGGISRIKAEEASRAASRMATPEPPSPVAGPSRIAAAPASGRFSPAPNSPESEELPSYSTGASPSSSAPPSPTVSEPADFESTNARLGAAGASLGFGNTSWTTTTMPGSMPGVHHPFGNSGVTTPSSVDVVDARATLPSPPPSDDGDDGFEKVEKAEEEGVSDAEMVSAPRSPM